MKKNYSIPLVYGVLMLSSVVFLLPLAWMIFTSIKLDREVFSEASDFFPEAPIPAKSSPYVYQNQFPVLEGNRVTEVLGIIEEKLNELPFSWPAELDQDSLRKQVARGLYQKIANTTPDAQWNGPIPELRRVIGARVDQTAVQMVIERVRRQLGIGTLVARSIDLKEDILASGENIARTWELGGNAEGKLVSNPKMPSASLYYHFENADQINLSHLFQTSFPIERLYRLQLGIQNDDSWHRVNVLIEKKGVKYKTSSPRYLSDTIKSVLIVQEPGPDDASNKIHNWTLLKEVDRGNQYDHGPNGLKVIIQIEKNTALGAWWAKITRNFVNVFDAMPFWRYVGTSLFLVTINIVCTLFSCSLVAYSFARLQWPGRSLCFVLMLGTMMIPHQVTMIPQFLIMKSAGFFNTLHPLWIGSLFAGGFNVFLLRQFFKGIPRDLEDAARIDGCGFWRIYWHIMIPLVKPTLITIAIFTFLHTWNDFMGPLIYISDQRLYPLSFGLYALNVQMGTGAASLGIMLAGAFLMILPVLLIFFIAQRYFVQGVTFTGMKG